MTTPYERFLESKAVSAPERGYIGNLQLNPNVAIKEILAFLKADPSTANWSDQAIQDLASTVYISSVKQGHVGLWERSNG